jgi:murein L,D-transpeptidase YafK
VIASVWQPHRAPLVWAKCFLITALMLAHVASPARPDTARGKAAPRAALPPVSSKGSPEARLLEVYRLIGASDARQALAKAEALTRDVPNFQLAQLVYADLLMARHKPLGALGDAPTGMAGPAAEQLQQLRREAAVRLSSLTERPPAQAVPREFIELPASTRHAIAVDASRSRLYLFENGPTGPKLIADHYVSVGRSGVGKKVQGDQRTPLGVYFITSRLDAAQLQDFYGAGALPLNYPNEYDRRQGKTGHGIWLHGVPSQNFARSPQSTDGCVVLANEDMQRLLQQVAPRRTPVLVTQRIEWVGADHSTAQRQAVRGLLEQWRQARDSGDLRRLTAFYSPQFLSGNLSLAQWSQQQSKELVSAKGKNSEIKELSILSWRDTQEIMVVTFGLVPQGQRSGSVLRQYWGKEGGQWKIFYEGVIG